ncbi:MAG: NAD kinase [Lactimicrobium sp.]|jgi:NAD+ kinase|uniref:NAD kinase n=1 Tax=Lactimicrobium sp. TaxID=2563780 RepID=UPI002F3582F0
MNKRYALVVRPDETSARIADQLRKRLAVFGCVEDEHMPETIFVIGGDGTFIYAVHEYMPHLNEVRFYGIHTGTLGFYTDYRDTDLDAFVDAYVNDKCTEVRYPILSAHYDGHEVHGINEIRIENASRTQVMEIYVNGRKFEDFRGTGICVCTQLGSTAYNRSLGGAVIQEGLRFIEMTEIAGIHHVKYRSLGSPIVMCEDTELRFDSESFDHALLGVDSDVLPLDGVKSITMHTSKDLWVRMLRGRSVSYFDRLKSLF